MPSFQKIKSSRVNNAAANVYVGNAGTMFFNSATGALRLSDGVTPGGQPVTVAIAGNVTFGNISVVDTTISTVMPNADLTLESNGTGDINLLGNVKAFVTGANVQSDIPIFTITSDGQVKMSVPDADQVAGALEVIGNDAGDFFPPNQTGVILHVTGNQNLPSRIYNDANNNYSLIVGRRYNGNVAAPTSVLNGEVMFRIAAQGSTGNVFQPLGPGRIEFRATQDQAVNAQGGNVSIYATANNTSANNAVQVASFDATTGLTVSGNITAAGATINGNVTTTGYMSGKYIRTVRDAGVIADGGTLTIDFSTDAIVYCTWANGMSLAYQNYTPGRVVKVMCAKAAGSGNDTLSLDGITAAQVSTGSTTLTGAQAQTQFIELTCVGTSIGTVYAKL